MATLSEVKHNIRTRTADYIDAYFNEHERYPVDIGLIHGDFIADELYDGFDWSDEINGFHDFSGGTPLNPLMFDRWISLTTTGDYQANWYYEWDGIQWNEFEPKIGKPFWIKSQEVHRYFDGDDWKQLTGSGGTTDHRDLENLNSTDYWHLTQSEYQALLLLPHIIDGKEDTGVAAGLVAAHENYWDHDSFLTELPSHSHLWADITDKPSTFAPAEHGLVSSTHTVSGLTPGHFLKATGATSFGFAAHGLTYSDVGAASADHVHAIADITNLQDALDDKQPLNSKLTDISNLSVTDGLFLVGNGSSIVSRALQNSDLPAIAITDTFVVSSQAAMLTLSAAERGDVAVRTDLNKSFILKGDNPASLSDWQELLTPTDAVLSVDGRTGVVSLSDKYQPLDTDLTAIAGLTHSNRHVMVSNGSSWTRRALEEADLPSLSAAKITSGTLSNDRLSFNPDYFVQGTNSRRSIAFGANNLDNNRYSTFFNMYNSDPAYSGLPGGLVMGLRSQHAENSNYSLEIVGLPGSHLYFGGLLNNVRQVWRKVWHEGNFDPADFAPSAHSHAWGEITGKPSTFAPAAHTLVSHTDWTTYFDQPLRTTDYPTFPGYNFGNNTFYTAQYSCPTATWVPIILSSTESSLLGGRSYRIKLTTMSTGIHNSAVYIIYQTLYDPSAVWEAKLVAHVAGGSNHPKLRVNGATVEIGHDHGITYSIRAQVEGFRSGNHTTPPQFFGLDGVITAYGNSISLPSNIDVGGTVDIRGGGIRFRNRADNAWEYIARWNPYDPLKNIQLNWIEDINAPANVQLNLNAPAGGIWSNGNHTFSDFAVGTPDSKWNTPLNSLDHVSGSLTVLGEYTPDSFDIPKTRATGRPVPDGAICLFINKSGHDVKANSKYPILNNQSRTFVFVENSWYSDDYLSPIGDDLILPGTTPTINLRGTQWGAILFGDPTQGHAISRYSASGDLVFSRLYNNVMHNLMSFTENGAHFFQPVYLDPSKVKAGTSQAGAGAVAGELWRNTSTGALHLGI